MAVHAYNPSTQEAKAGGWLSLRQSGLHKEILSQKKKKISNTRQKKFKSPYLVSFCH
jgi:hypothetical protein